MKKYRIKKWINIKSRDYNFSIEMLVEGKWVNLLTAKTVKQSIYKTKEEAKAILNFLNYSEETK